MPQQFRSPSPTIAIIWAFATALALVTTYLLLTVLPSLDSAVIFLVAPLLLGSLQWLVLRQLLPKAWWWIPLTAIGTGLAWLSAFCFLWFLSVFGNALIATNIEMTWIPDIVFFSALSGAAGFGIGCPQWLYLRRHVPKAGWWCLASTIALAIGAGFNFSAGLEVSNNYHWPLSLAAGGLLGGSIKGGALMWLLKKRPNQTPPNSTSDL